MAGNVILSPAHEVDYSLKQSVLYLGILTWHLMPMEGSRALLREYLPFLPVEWGLGIESGSLATPAAKCRFALL